ncbi:hypothetical protein E2C01_033091 [Portunus trituberculatus]|uniref:Uncharacterized protein n=1 Tax=Portunus trituberculatus TaxID=210409 RepID=A0A5B7EXN3_PORTR|nr:hypothetical protein [Portunus trituberculatus]
MTAERKAFCAHHRLQGHGTSAKVASRIVAQKLDVASRAHALESSEFSTLDSIVTLKLNLCAVYLYPNSSDYSKFFDYLSSKVEHILSSTLSRRSPSLEISMFTISFGFHLLSQTILVN